MEKVSNKSVSDKVVGNIRLVRIQLLVRSMRRLHHLLRLSLQDFQKLLQKLVPKITGYDYWLFYWKCLFETNWFVLQILMERLCLLIFLLPLLNCFLSLFFFALCSCHQNFSTANNFWIFWQTLFNKSACVFCSWDETFSQKGDFSSWASAPNLRPRCRPIPLRNGISTCLERTIL